MPAIPVTAGDVIRVDRKDGAVIRTTGKIGVIDGPQHGNSATAKDGGQTATLSSTGEAYIVATASGTVWVP